MVLRIINKPHTRCREQYVSIPHQRRVIHTDPNVLPVPSKQRMIVRGALSGRRPFMLSCRGRASAEAHKSLIMTTAVETKENEWLGPRLCSRDQDVGDLL